MVTATVRGNGGTVTLAASTLGALQNGTNTIDWTEITTTTSVPRSPRRYLSTVRA